MAQLRSHGAIGHHRARVEVPEASGFLLIERHPGLRPNLPVREIALPALCGADVKRNEFYRFTLRATLAQLEELGSARSCKEVARIGRFRTPVRTVAARRSARRE